MKTLQAGGSSAIARPVYETSVDPSETLMAFSAIAVKKRMRERWPE